MKYLHVSFQYIITTLFLLLWHISMSQTSGINGLVIDRITQTPVPQAVIKLNVDSEPISSDSSGSFRINLKPGSYQIIFSKLGYEKQTINAEVSENKFTNTQIPLNENTIELDAADIISDRPVSAASSKYLSDIDFKNRPKNSAQDMLRLVPGLFIAQHAGGGKAEQIFIRGFDCDHGTDVATFVDGIPVNMPSHGHGQGYEDLHFLIPETVGGMEIFKGPYAPQFGNFATGAAVKFNTIDSLEKNSFQLESGYVPQIKSVTTNRALLLYQLPFKPGKIKSFVAGEAIANRSYFESDQHFKRLSVFSKTVLQLNNQSCLRFSIGSFQSSWDASGQIPERAVQSGLISRFGSIDNSEGGITSRSNYNVGYTTILKSGVFDAQAYVSTYQFRLFSNFTFFLDDPVHGDQIEQTDNRTIKGINLKYSTYHRLFNMDNRITVGGTIRNDIVHNGLWHTEKQARIEPRVVALIHERATGFYMNEEFHFSDRVRIEAGGRFDYINFNVKDFIPADTVRGNYTGGNYQSLFSPKLNFIYCPTANTQLFLNSGIGFHSNDARSVVRQAEQHHLPSAPGAETGILKHFRRSVVTASVWTLFMENELVYVGDAGTTEDRGSSRRTGIDISVRYQFNRWLIFDADLNVARNVFTSKLFGKRMENDYYIPLAPVFCSAGGASLRITKTTEAAIRYRYMSERPANESASVIARGYFVTDCSVNYKRNNYKLGISVENLFNTEWNEAQFDTESKLSSEVVSTDELHFTPGTPFSLKLIAAVLF